MTTKIVGELEVDEARGVIYFHNYRNGGTCLRICGLGKRLDKFTELTQLDVSLDVPPPHHFIISRSDLDEQKPKKGAKKS